MPSAIGCHSLRSSLRAALSKPYLPFTLSIACSAQHASRDMLHGACSALHAPQGMLCSSCLVRHALQGMLPLGLSAYPAGISVIGHATRMAGVLPGPGFSAPRQKRSVAPRICAIARLRIKHRDLDGASVGSRWSTRCLLPLSILYMEKLPAGCKERSVG